jgi:hypothetical protein
MSLIGSSPDLFLPIVKWITFARRFPGQDAVHRMAQANFDIRGWQGRWWYIALTALFFVAGSTRPPTRVCPLRDDRILAFAVLKFN